MHTVEIDLKYRICLFEISKKLYSYLLFMIYVALYKINTERLTIRVKI